MPSNATSARYGHVWAIFVNVLPCFNSQYNRVFDDCASRRVILLTVNVTVMASVALYSSYLLTTMMDLDVDDAYTLGQLTEKLISGQLKARRW